MPPQRMHRRACAVERTRTVIVHLVDGTYELFRHYYAVPRRKDADGREVGAVRGVVQSLLGLVTGGATHKGVATDHVIESFRNRLWPGYKTGDGIERSEERRVGKQYKTARRAHPATAQR